MKFTTLFVLFSFCFNAAAGERKPGVRLEKDEPAQIEPIPETQVLPPPASAHGDEKPPSLPEDGRPVVFFYSAPFHCPPCEKGTEDIANGNLPHFRVEFRDAPAWVKSFPTLHFKSTTSETGWSVHTGWTTPGAFVSTWQAANPGVKLTLPPAAVAAAPVGQPPPVATGESPIALFQKFAGPGKFSWSPDKPVGAYIDDNTFIKYSRLAGSVKIVQGSPVITIDQPYPEISARKFGLWFRVDLLGATGNLNDKPPTVTIRHSMGRYKLEIKEMK